MKICYKCGIKQPITSFYVQKSRCDGVQSRCKLCSKPININYRATHGGKISALQAAWYVLNAERLKLCSASWRTANPIIRLIYWHNRRVKMSGRLSQGLSAKLFILQKGRCTCCNQPLGDDYHLDHIMPIKLGGLNEDFNMQLLRAKCNMQKSGKHPTDFMQSRGFLL